MNKILSAWFLLAFTVQSWSAEDSKRIAQELASAVHTHMIATYSCQNYVGGLAMYRSAKLNAENIFLKMGVDRNKAVILLNEGEEKIKADAPAQMKKMERMPAHITQEDKRNGCIQTISDSADKVKLLQAKLGLL